MTHPYTSPNQEPTLKSENDKLRRKRMFWFKAIWVSLAGVIIPPLFGLLGTIFGMIRAFGELSETGEADPEALASNISVGLLTTAGGLSISVLALFILIGVLIRFFTLPKDTPS